MQRAAIPDHLEQIVEPAEHVVPRHPVDQTGGVSEETATSPHRPLGRRRSFARDRHAPGGAVVEPAAKNMAPIRARRPVMIRQVRSFVRRVLQRARRSLCWRGNGHPVRSADPLTVRHSRAASPSAVAGLRRAER